MVGRDPVFQQMLQRVTKLAPSEVNVLLLGESGTGKKLVAKAIHEASSKSGKPFVTFNCSGLTETFFECELFGCEQGACTGDNSQSDGLINAANGGTLFLDEVGDIPLMMQAKLLRLLDRGTYRRVGSVELHKSDIRLISSTHSDLRAMMAVGSFRRDLYFRLSTFPIELPPLRDRLSDIPILVKSILTRILQNNNVIISEEANELLLHYNYPGNVRELRNIIERASILCDGRTIQPSHLLITK